MDNQDIKRLVKNIEKEKENRSKCVFYFTMSVTVEEKKIFKKKLKNDIK